jgi:hypothetical protein
MRIDSSSEAAEDVKLAQDSLEKNCERLLIIGVPETLISGYLDMSLRNLVAAIARRRKNK